MTPQRTTGKDRSCALLEVGKGWSCMLCMCQWGKYPLAQQGVDASTCLQPHKLGPAAPAQRQPGEGRLQPASWGPGPGAGCQHRGTQRHHLQMQSALQDSCFTALAPAAQMKRRTRGSTARYASCQCRTSCAGDSGAASRCRRCHTAATAPWDKVPTCNKLGSPQMRTRGGILPALVRPLEQARAAPVLCRPPRGGKPSF